MSITNENEPTKPAGEIAEAVPHSGVHFDEQPVDVFDSTPLEEAHEQGLIGPVPETIPPALEQPLIGDTAPTKSKKFIGIGVGAAALALAGGAFMFSQKGGKPATAAAPVATSAPSPTTTTEATPTTNPTPEAIGPEELPVFITGTTAQEIMNQYTHNENCSLNAHDYDRQIACLEHNLGNLENSGTLGPDQVKTINEVNRYRLDHPDFNLVTTYEIKDSKMLRTQLEVVVVETDHAGSYYRYMRFNRTTATTENLTVDGANQDIWLVREIRNIQPGEVTFH